MRHYTTIAAAGLLTAGAIGVPVAQAQNPPASDQEIEQDLNSIPDPSTAPGGPQDTSADDGSDNPAPSEPPDPPDDDPDNAAAPAPTPVVTPAATTEAVVTTPTPEPTSVATPTATPTVIAAATPSATPTPIEATPTPTPALASPTPTPTVASPTVMRRKVTRRKVLRVQRPATDQQRRQSAHSTRTAGRSAPAASNVRPVVRVRVAHQTLVAAAPRSGEYVVRRGDTLAAIAARLGTDWPALWALNRDRIADPDLIYAGQVLRT